MLFQQILDQAKTEGRVTSDDDFNAIGISLLNEAFKETVEAHRPFELRETVFLTPSLTTGLAILPTNFFIAQQFFFEDESGKEWELPSFDKIVGPSGLSGHPKSFQVVGTNVLLDPITNITGGDRVRLVYYKKPPEVTPLLLVTENPITRLEPFLVRFMITRIRILHLDDVTAIQQLNGQISSAANAYSNDDPQRTSRSDKG